MNWKEIVGLVSGVVALLTVAAAMVWGVPYYVDIKVEQRVKVLAANAGTPESVQLLQQDVAKIQGQLGPMATDLAATRADAAETKRLLIEFLRQ